MFLSFMLLLCLACGGNGEDSSGGSAGVHSVEEVAERFSERDIELRITRDLRGEAGSAALQAILVPADPKLTDRFAVNVLRGKEEAQAFARNIEAAGSTQHVIHSENVVLVYVATESGLTEQLKDAMESL